MWVTVKSLTVAGSEEREKKYKLNKELEKVFFFIQFLYSVLFGHIESILQVGKNVFIFNFVYVCWLWQLQATKGSRRGKVVNKKNCLYDFPKKSLILATIKIK